METLFSPSPVRFLGVAVAFRTWQDLALYWFLGWPNGQLLSFPCFIDATSNERGEPSNSPRILEYDNWKIKRRKKKDLLDPFALLREI